MTNRIREVRICDQLHDPTQPEIWIDVVPEQEGANAEVRGRLMGPRCLYSSTVEVAYPLRPFAKAPEGFSGLARRVVIPEASLWEPQSPFLYEGPVELWQDGVCHDQVWLSRGLRRLQLGPQGLRVNGRAFSFRGAPSIPATDEDARRLRSQGFNALVVSVPAQPATLWEVADRWGFFVIGRLDGSETSFRLAHSLKEHPSCLGWLLPHGFLDRCSIEKTALPELEPFLGMELERLPDRPFPAGVRFVAGSEVLLGSLESLGLPGLILP